MFLLRTILNKLLGIRLWRFKNLFGKARCLAFWCERIKKKMNANCCSVIKCARTYVTSCHRTWVYRWAFTMEVKQCPQISIWQKLNSTGLSIFITALRSTFSLRNSQKERSASFSIRRVWKRKPVYVSRNPDFDWLIWVSRVDFCSIRLCCK